MKGFTTRSYKKLLKDMEFSWEKRRFEGCDGCVQIFGLKACQVNGFELFFALQEEQPGSMSSNNTGKDSRFI